MTEQIYIAAGLLALFAAGVFGYWVRGAENESARQPDETENGVGRTL